LIRDLLNAIIIYFAACMITAKKLHIQLICIVHHLSTLPQNKQNHHSRPKKGSALIFFPSAGGIPNTPFDIRTLHCGEVVSENAENEKWITQLWLRERGYKPTAPAGNEHANASDAIGKYCDDCSE